MLDQREFLFGVEPSTTAAMSRANGGLNRSFLSVVKYLKDLGQNFVLADSKCNGKKRHARGSASVRSRLYESDRLLRLSADAGAHGLFRGDELREVSPEWRNYLALLDTWHELLGLRLLKL